MPSPGLAGGEPCLSPMADVAPAPAAAPLPPAAPKLDDEPGPQPPEPADPMDASESMHTSPAPGHGDGFEPDAPPSEPMARRGSRTRAGGARNKR